MTPLHWSVYYGKLDIAKMLIRQGADVNARDASGETPMHYAAARSTPNLARLLLENGADVNSADAMDQTPLHFAAIWSGQTRTPEFLIGSGAKVNVEDKDGNTPLALAEERLFDDLAVLLRRHGGRLRANAKSQQP